MASIGGVSVDIMRGLPMQLRTRLETWQVPGLDGYGAMNLGLGDSEFDLVTVLYADSDAAANAAVANYTELQGQVVTVLDDWGDSYEKVLIVHVNTMNSKSPCIYQGNAVAVRVEVKWQCLTST